MENIIEKLTSNRYKVLKILYENQVELKTGDKISILTQKEISEQIGLSVISINQIFKDLQNDGLIKQKTRGQYILMDTALDIVKNIEKLSEKGDK